MIIEYLIANAIIGGMSIAGYFLVKQAHNKRNKPIICNHCSCLLSISGGKDKTYKCTLGGTLKFCTHSFDEPPEYCAYYIPRETLKQEATMDV